MSGLGGPDLDVDAKGLTLGIVATRWHAELTEALVDGALRAATGAGVETKVVRVAGSVELPVVAQQLSADYDAVVVLGVVIRGDTPHFEYVCDAVTSGCMRVALDSGTPVGFGVLTVDTVEQARERAGLSGSSEDKGREAVQAALSTAVLLRQLRHPQARGAGF